MLSELATSRILGTKLSGGQIPQRGTGVGSTATAQVEPEALELTRMGRRFSGIGGTTGVAPVQAVPTTAAAWVLYNAESSGGKSYAVDDVSFWLLSGTATAGLTVLGIVSDVTSTLPTAATGSAISSRSRGGLTSRAVFGTGYTLPAQVAGAQGWFVIGSSVGGVPGVGGGYSVDTKGKIVVPPGKVLGLTVLAGAGTSPLYIPGVTWVELELDLE